MVFQFFSFHSQPFWIGTSPISSQKQYGGPLLISILRLKRSNTSSERSLHGCDRQRSSVKRRQTSEESSAKTKYLTVSIFGRFCALCSLIGMMFRRTFSLFGTR